jgi:hypothetical protein
MHNKIRFYIVAVNGMCLSFSLPPKIIIILYNCLSWVCESLACGKHGFLSLVTDVCLASQQQYVKKKTIMNKIVDYADKYFAEIVS